MFLTVKCTVTMLETDKIDKLQRAYNLSLNCGKSLKMNYLSIKGCVLSYLMLCTNIDNIHSYMSTYVNTTYKLIYICIYVHIYIL